MTNEQIRIALATRLSTWSGLPQSSIQYPNKKFTPPEIGIWARVTFLSADSQIAGIADKPYTRKNGQIVIQVFDRIDAGSAAINTVADSLEAWLSYFKTGDLELLQTTTDVIGDDGNGFYQVNSRTLYRAG